MHKVLPLQFGAVSPADISEVQLFRLIRVEGSIMCTGADERIFNEADLIAAERFKTV